MNHETTTLDLLAWINAKADTVVQAGTTHTNDVAMKICLAHDYFDSLPSVYAEEKGRPAPKGLADRVRTVCWDRVSPRHVPLPVESGKLAWLLAKAAVRHSTSGESVSHFDECAEEWRRLFGPKPGSITGLLVAARAHLWWQAWLEKATGPDADTFVDDPNEPPPAPYVPQSPQGPIDWYGTGGAT